jgi:hypothetical protein
VTQPLLKWSVPLTVLLLIGCAAPGAPALRASEADGEGALLQNCHNVSALQRVDQLITGYYMTTWGSAFLEGAQEGIRRGVEVPELKSNSRSRTAAPVQVGPQQWSVPVNHLPSPPWPYCRRYAADARSVAESAARALPGLGNPVERVDLTAGILETGFLERRHSAARWRDKFVVYVDAEGPNRSVLTVFRVVYIDRSGGMFNQAVSVGHHEAWLMTRIAEDLTGRK